MNDPYKILGIAYKASLEQIKEAYKQAARESHPDKGGDPERMTAVTEAHRQLTTCRKDVDKLLQFLGQWPKKFCGRCEGRGVAKSIANPKEEIRCPKCGGSGL